MFEEENINPEIILPVFEFDNSVIEDNNNIVYYDTYCFIIDDLKKRFMMNNFYNPYLIGSLLPDKFVNNFKNKYMSKEDFNILSNDEIKIYNSLPSIFEIINVDLKKIEEDFGIKEDNIKCNYCFKILKDNFLKSIIHNNNKIKVVHYCSFKCFENTDNSYWPKYKKPKK